MTAAGTNLARSISLSIIPVFMVACFAISSARTQQLPGLEVIEYEGTVAAAREAEVAARLEGLLDKIDFSAGQLVKQGDLLFEFAPKNNELRLALAQATLRQAEADLRLAEVKLKNKQTLRSRNVAAWLSRNSISDGKIGAVRQAMVRAHAADAAGDKTACEEALADARSGHSDHDLACRLWVRKTDIS
jgi:multidrug efflux pump subunit AcrA (membrane-fusion protein)